MTTVVRPHYFKRSVPSDPAALPDWLTKELGTIAQVIRVVPDLFVSVKEFGATGNGGTDDYNAIVRAIAVVAAAGGGVVFFPQGTYLSSATIAVSARVTLLGCGAGVSILKCAVGYTANYLVELKNAARIAFLTLDGTNLPTPSAAWLGVGFPVGCLLVADGTSVAANDLDVESCILQNTTSGGMYFKTVLRPRVSNTQCNTIQSYTANATSAGIELNACNDARLLDCTVNSYTLKAFNIGNSARAVGVRCHAYGGAQNTGNAAHYISGGTDCAYLDCTHEGAGFGFKANDTTRPALVQYTANGSATMAYFQGCKDFLMLGGTGILTDVSHQGIIVEGISGVLTTETGLIEGVTVRRPSALTDTNFIGIHFLAASGFPVNNVTVRDCTFENMYISVLFAQVSSAVYNGIVFENIRSVTPVAYSFLVYAKNVAIRFCRLDTGSDGASPAIAIYSSTSVVADLWEITDNTFYTLNAAIDAIQVGVDGTNSFGCKVTSVVIRGNRVVAGNRVVYVDLSNTAGGAGTNYITALTIQDNIGEALTAATAMQLTMGTVQTGRVNLIGNTLQTSGGGLKNVVFANDAQVTGGIITANDVNAITNKPAAATALLTAGTHLAGGPYDGNFNVTLTTDATNANTASTIVARDTNGAFSAGIVTPTGVQLSGTGLSFAAGQLCLNATNGLTLAGKTGSSYDAVLTNNAGQTYLAGVTATQDLVTGAKLTVTGITTFSAPATLKGYTVATLPAGVQGHMAYCTDLTAPTYLGALTGGGAVVGPVFYNGAAWVST